MSEHSNVIDCTEIQRLIWTDGPLAAPSDHIDTCSACREQARRAADLDAALHGLRTRDAIVPLELEASIVAAVNQTRFDRARGVVSHPKFWKGAAVGAAAAATAVAGLIVARKLAGRPDVDTDSEPEPSLVA
jgi:predicted anti-sigma-YlaC factor YlaD